VELVRSEQIRMHDRSPAEVARAVELCDNILDMLARLPDHEATFSQLERDIVDERLQILGSTAVRRDTDQD
jgi:hypothetical protein